MSPVTLSTPVVLTTEPTPLAVIGTVGLLALFFSVTAHLAARNVLGEVPVVTALGVGIGPALVSVGTPLLSVPGGIGVFVALVVDGFAIHWLYGQPRRTSVYITAIHVIVTVLLGTVLFGVLAIAMTAPG